MAEPLHILCLLQDLPDLATSAFGPFVLHPVGHLDEARLLLRHQRLDASLLDLAQVGGAERLWAWEAWSRLCAESAVVVLDGEPGPALCGRLLQKGAADVLPRREARAETLARVLRVATERRRLDLAARQAHGVDLATGLPNRAQLLEHMNHLLALREREPAAMGLIVLRLGGLGGVESRMGQESAQVVRRKAAVRLRAALRASDVVASLGGNEFAVLLAWIDAGDSVGRVAQKLVAALVRPYAVAGQNVVLAVSQGAGQYPAHGKAADVLLSRALAMLEDQGLPVSPGAGRAANDD
ncbi:GGDEF domain-containing protein [Ideonella livida]|uniref:GGDEF domain-containing protein n=1 Tax=Ideonella livida TaxID=2707176 RepID=A0A7C9PEV2_9BURK|nr:GGDEF domain-containing protein [Ideonella livida]NDY90137.1 GGDEF domain-containing protein [Ideonella livida]